MYDENDLLPLSGIQHLAFCERQWALIHLEGQWEESQRTVAGDILHQRVHSQQNEARGDTLLLRSVPLISYMLGIRGVSDMVESVKSTDGIKIPHKRGLWKLYPVEYKVGQAKCDDRDQVQLCAQAMCLEEMYHTVIPEGSLYYGKERRRQVVSLDDTLRRRVSSLCHRMHQLFEAGTTPSPPKGKRCSLCSLKDVCVPYLGKKATSVSYYYQKYLTSIPENGATGKEEPE